MTEAVHCAGCALSCDWCDYEVSCPRTGTRAVAVACQLAWESTIYICRTSRPWISYVVIFRGARKTWTIWETWAAWNLGPVACFLPVHHCLDWLGTGSREPGSSSLAPLGGWDWSWVFESSPETTRKAAKRWGSHSAAFQEENIPNGTPQAVLVLGQVPCCSGPAFTTHTGVSLDSGICGDLRRYSRPSTQKYSPAANPRQGTGDIWSTRFMGLFAGHFGSLGLKALSGRT